ncbi:MAG: copper resistance protein CopC [Chloroflexota bacterium]
MPGSVRGRIAASAGGRRVRPPVRPPVAALLALLALLALAAPAGAHARLVSLEPPDGSRLATAPAAVVLTVHEPIGLAPGGIGVLDAAGRPVDTAPEVADGPRITQPLPPLADGWYVATWAIVSEDGHIIRSAAVFGVGDADAALRPTVADAGADLPALAARAVADLGTLVLAGAALAALLLGVAGPRTDALAVGAALLVLAGTGTMLAIGWLEGGPAWLRTLPAATLGLRAVLLALALLLRGRPRPRALLALGALCLIPFAGHAAGDPPAAGLHAVHLLLAATWLGAAPAVLLALRDPALPDAAALGSVRAFSRLAGIALLGVGAAGAALAWRLSDGFMGGLTPWTAILVVKVAIVGVAVLLGAAGRRHLAGSPGRGRFRRLFAVDLVLLVAVVTASAGLNVDDPHGGHRMGGPARCTLRAGDLALSLVVSPGGPGSSTLVVGGAPADARSVRLALTHPATGGAPLVADATARTAGDGWEAVLVLPLAGAWEAEVVVRVDTFTEVRGTCRLALSG